MHGSSDVTVPLSIAKDFAGKLQVCARKTALQHAKSAVIPLEHGHVIDACTACDSLLALCSILMY